MKHISFEMSRTKYRVHSRWKEKADFRQRNGNFTEFFERFRVMVRHDAKKGRQCFRNGFTQEIKSKKSFRTGQLFLYAEIGHKRIPA